MARLCRRTAGCVEKFTSTRTSRRAAAGRGRHRPALPGGSRGASTSKNRTRSGGHEPKARTLGAPASVPARFSNCNTPARTPALQVHVEVFRHSAFGFLLAFGLRHLSFRISDRHVSSSAKAPATTTAEAAPAAPATTARAVKAIETVRAGGCPPAFAIEITGAAARFVPTRTVPAFVRPRG